MSLVIENNDDALEHLQRIFANGREDIQYNRIGRHELDEVSSVRGHMVKQTASATHHVSIGIAQGP